MKSLQISKFAGIFTAYSITSFHYVIEFIPNFSLKHSCDI